QPDRLSLYPISKNVSRAHLFELVGLFVDSPSIDKDNHKLVRNLAISPDATSSRRTATIEFHTDADVDVCLEGLDGAWIDGLQVKVTRSKAPIVDSRRYAGPPPSRGGGGGGRYPPPSGRGGYGGRGGRGGGDSYFSGGERKGSYDRDNRDRDYGRRPPPRDYDSRARSPPRGGPVGGLAGRGGRDYRSRSPVDRRR
ncbi:UNVERIFIED_CONTAM: hypothetical protein HDU68_010503, partial [Siphonaria sp. JEL0065]